MVAEEAEEVVKRDAAWRRSRVIAVSRRLFADNGFHGTGVAQIANESGIAVGQIYRDFASKNAIVASIVEEDCIALVNCQSLAAAVADGDGRGIEKWIDEFVDPRSDDKPDPRIFAEIMAESSRSPEMAAIFRKSHAEVRKTLRYALALVAPGAAAEAERDLLAEVILTFGIGLLHRHVVGDDRRTGELVATLNQIVASRIDAMGRAASPTADRHGPSKEPGRR